VLYDLGIVALHHGDLGAARERFQESLAMKRDFGDKRGLAYSLEGFAILAAVQGRAERAARLFGAAEVLREAINSPLPPPDRVLYDRYVTPARAGRAQEAFAAAWAQGQTMMLEEAIAFALEEKIEDPS
jgi:hypothetical protein